MHTPPRTYRQLQPEDRVTMAAMKQQNYSASAMARVLGRPVCTITRELKRNSTGASYASTQAQASSQRRRLDARPMRKLHMDSTLFGVVKHFLTQRWSPEQIALAMARVTPKDMSFACRTRRSTTASTPSPWASSSAS